MKNRNPLTSDDLVVRYLVGFALYTFGSTLALVFAGWILFFSGRAYLQHEWNRAYQEAHSENVKKQAEIEKELKKLERR